MDNSPRQGGRSRGYNALRLGFPLNEKNCDLIGQKEVVRSTFDICIRGKCN